jgi:hypothetical protein
VGETAPRTSTIFCVGDGRRLQGCLTRARRLRRGDLLALGVGAGRRWSGCRRRWSGYRRDHCWRLRRDHCWRRCLRCLLRDHCCSSGASDTITAGAGASGASGEITADAGRRAVRQRFCFQCLCRWAGASGEITAGPRCFGRLVCLCLSCLSLCVFLLVCLLCHVWSGLVSACRSVCLAYLSVSVW